MGRSINNGEPGVLYQYCSTIQLHLGSQIALDYECRLSLSYSSRGTKHIMAKSDKTLVVEYACPCRLNARGRRSLAYLIFPER